MPLATGQSLSYYEILGSLGSGAMGEVYRARDTRLDREVAIKVLPEHFGEEKERLMRFEREAKSLASLNHPNVAQVFGIDQVDGVRFIAMELVPGENLSERLKRGPLPIDEAVDICHQIASGLEAAHEAGVIHRDLKPANVCITPDGKVKVLDFGLAKPVGLKDIDDSTDDSALPTEEGRLLGTPTYMAPEQARGRQIDRRVDVWAFGCVLFECLTATRAFAGETLPDLLAAVLERGWDRSALPTRTPARVRELLERCLDKDPHTRLRDIGEARVLLERTDEEVLDTGLRKYRIAVVCLVLLTLLAGTYALVAAMGSGEQSGPAEEALQTWQLSLPTDSKMAWRGSSSNLSKLGGGSALLAISRDGRRVVYCVKEGGRSSLYVHELGKQHEGRSIPGTDDARGPFFSPDGERIGFFADNALKFVSLKGRGAPQPICSFTSWNFAGYWMSEDRIIYSTNTGLWLVQLGGGEPERLTNSKQKSGEIEHSGPRVLPDGDSVLFTVWSGRGAHIALLSLETREWHTVVKDGSNPNLLSDGRLLYAQGKGLRIGPFEPDKNATRPISEPVLDGIFTTPSAGGAVITHFAVSNNGRLIYAPDVPEPPHSIVYLVNRAGEVQEIASGLGIWEHPRVSPDGLRYGLDIRNDLGGKNIHVYTFESGLPQILTENGTSIMCSWSSDNDVIARSTQVQNEVFLVSLRSLESTPLFKMGELGDSLFLDCWGSDESAFFTRKTSTSNSIWLYGPNTGEPRELLGTDLDARYSAISPDGQWLAYVRQVGEDGEVYVQSFPAMDQPVPISIDGGGEPLWSKDGTELFYRKGKAVFKVDVGTDSVWRRTTPRKLFELDVDFEPGGHRHYDLSPDGEHFLMIKHFEMRPDRVNVVLNWLDQVTPGR